MIAADSSPLIYLAALSDFELLPLFLAAFTFLRLFSGRSSIRQRDLPFGMLYSALGL